VHFFTFNIGDWNKKTAHLSPIEEFVYFKLVCFCYETELPIPSDLPPTIRKLRLQKHADIVSAILTEYFILSADGWKNKRVDEELEIIYKKSGESMSTKIIKSCDRCGIEVSGDDQFWRVGIRAVCDKIIRFEDAGFVDSRHAMDVCRPCLELMGIHVLKRDNTPPPQAPSLEELIREICRQERV